MAYLLDHFQDEEIKAKKGKTSCPKQQLALIRAQENWLYSVL